MLRFIISLIALSLLAGCGGGPEGPELADVSGVVTVDGEPKANLLVTFQPEEGRPSAGKTNESGEYVLKYTRDEQGAVVGKHVVSITTMTEATEGGCCGCCCCGSGCGCGCGDPGAAEPIDPKYNFDAKNNPKMTVEVKEGANEFNFDVETDPEARRAAAASSGGGGRSGGCCCG